MGFTGRVGYQETSSVCSSARWHARLWCWRFVPFVAFGYSAQRRVGRATGKTFKPLNLLLIGNSLDSPFRMIDMWTSPSWTNLIHRFWSYSGRNLWNRILWEICDLSFNKSWLAFFLRIFASWTQSLSGWRIQPLLWHCKEKSRKCFQWNAPKAWGIGSWGELVISEFLSSREVGEQDGPGSCMLSWASMGSVEH